MLAVECGRRSRVMAPCDDTPCSRFVDELIALTQRVRSQASPGKARRRLANELVYEFVPPVRILGVNVRRCIAGRDSRPERILRPRLSEEGFKRALVRGGQNEEVVRHVASAAACVLAGRSGFIAAANLVDRLQGLIRNGVEARAEVAGNQAGAEVGRCLQACLAGGISPDEARRWLLRVLCEHAD